VLQLLPSPETTQINCIYTLMSYTLKVMRVFTPLSRNFTRSVKNNHRQRSLLNQTSPISYLALSLYSHNNTSLIQSTNLKTSTCVVSNNYTINKNNKCSFSSQHHNSHNSHSHSHNNNSNRGVRYFPNYTIYKDDSVLTIKYLAPSFKINNQKINIGKKGKIVFDIAPRMQGNKMTDWSNAMNIALNPEELGHLLSNLMILNELTTFTHTSLQGVSKVLTIDANYTDGHYSFKLNANDNSKDKEEEEEGNNNNSNREQCVVITDGEMNVVKNIINATLPNLVAWDVLVDQSIETLVHNEKSNYSSAFDPLRNDFDI